MSAGGGPPRLAAWLFRRLTPSRLWDDVLGDLDREFSQVRRPRDGRLRATLWYWFQVLSFTWTYARGRRSFSPGIVLSDLVQDVRQAVRGLRASPAFAATALVTLGLGIGANTAVFSVIHQVLLRPLPYPEADRLVAVGSDRRSFGDADLMAAGAEYRDIEERATSLEDIAAAWPIDANVAGGGEPERARVVLGSWNLFSVLRVRPALGRTFTPDDARGDIGYVGILSFRAWQQLFDGDPGILGRTLRLDDDPISIIGVMPEGFGQPGESPADPVSVWMPISFQAGNRFDLRGARNLTLVGRLRSGVSLESARADLSSVARTVAAEHPDAYPAQTGWTLRAEPLRDRIVGDARPMLLILMAAVGFVLLAACTNVAALLLARGRARSTEIAVRVALGGGRRRIFRQFLTESLVLSLLGAVVGLGIAGWGLTTLRGVAVEALPRAAGGGLSAPVLGFTALVSVLTTLAFGLLPAASASRSDPYQLLRSGRSVGGARVTARALLATSQVAVSVALLVGGGLLLKSFLGLTRGDPGFETDQVLAFQTWLPIPNDPSQGRFATAADRSRFAHRVLDALEEQGAIERAAVVSRLPFRGSAALPFRREEDPEVDPAALPTVEFRQASADYFEVMGIPLLEGRDLEDTDDADHVPVVVVDRSMAERWLGPDPIGQTIHLGGGAQGWQVVGVVGDVRDRPLDPAPRPHVYLSDRQSLTYGLSFVMRWRGSPGAAASAVRTAMNRVDPDQPIFGVATLEEALGESLARERLLGGLVGLFALVALALAALGIYGLTAYRVRQRRQEIGIRMALGAASRDVISLALGETVRIGVAGIALGLVAALMGAGLLRAALHGVDPIDPAILAAVAGLAALVSLVAGTVPARRAARVDPVETMRRE